jgi:hypothetical protein
LCGLKLYGGQQIQRLLQEFNYKIHEPKSMLVTLEEIGILSGFLSPEEVLDHNVDFEAVIILFIVYMCNFFTR